MARIDVLAGMVDETKPFWAKTEDRKAKKKAKGKVACCFVQKMFRLSKEKAVVIFLYIANAKTDDNDAAMSCFSVVKLSNPDLSNWKKIELWSIHPKFNYVFLFLRHFRPQN